MKIIPQSDYILLIEVSSESNEHGIIIPENVDMERTLPGRVERVGDAVKLPLKEGDMVLFKRHLFDEVVYNGTKYLFGREANILALLA